MRNDKKTASIVLVVVATLALALFLSSKEKESNLEPIESSTSGVKGDRRMPERGQANQRAGPKNQSIEERIVSYLLTFTVLSDLDDTPIEGVSVFLIDGTERRFDPSKKQSLGKTDKLGVLESKFLESRIKFGETSFCFNKDGWVPQRILVQKGSTRIQTRLLIGNRIEFSFVDLQGAPIEGVEVNGSAHPTIVNVPPNLQAGSAKLLPAGSERHSIFSGKTNETGQVEFSTLPPGEFIFHFRHEFLVPIKRSYVAIEVSSKPGIKVAHEIQMAELFVLHLGMMPEKIRGIEYEWDGFDQYYLEDALAQKEAQRRKKRIKETEHGEFLEVIAGSRIVQSSKPESWPKMRLKTFTDGAGWSKQRDFTFRPLRDKGGVQEAIRDGVGGNFSAKLRLKILNPDGTFSGFDDVVLRSRQLHGLPRQHFPAEVDSKGIIFVVPPGEYVLASPPPYLKLFQDVPLSLKENSEMSHEIQLNVKLNQVKLQLTSNFQSSVKNVLIRAGSGDFFVEGLCRSNNGLISKYWLPESPGKLSIVAPGFNLLEIEFDSANIQAGTLEIKLTPKAVN